MKKNIVIIILSILLIGLSGYLVYDKVLKKNALEDVQQNEDNQGEELKTIYNKDSAWLNYLKSVNITSAKISFVEYKTEYFSPSYGDEISLSEDEINTLFSYIDSGVLTSNYFGYAVPSVFDYLIIEYDDGKWVEFLEFKYIETNDETLEKKFIQDMGVSQHWYRCDWDYGDYYKKYNK